ncbi:CvfB family protein [Reichenbachiella versicolor]|uniref:CvfB family protein n=1 Tax=Reichenbachiella versicolor TaxID=1821036 RepID=UPI000D6E3ECB|nr:S1-like domain-containing RNA-binding protein [Reichenbachiella versicolor]
METGTFNTLLVNRFTSNGAYLIDKEKNEVLLPNKYVQENLSEGDNIEVFIYTDSEDRLVATTIHPKVIRNQFACLEVKDTSSHGAFLDWGLEKDLFVPFKEQERKMRSGQWYLIYAYLDPLTKRMVASSYTHRYLSKKTSDLEEGSEVEIIIGTTSPFGIQVIVNNQFQGLLYENEVFEELLMGAKKIAYIKKIREDGKLDISLRKAGLENLEEGAQKILEALKRNSGTLALHDKSSPEEVQLILQMSKKNFKRSLGILYKLKKVNLNNKKISLI